MLVYENVGNGFFVQRSSLLGDSTPFDSVSSYVTSFTDLDFDGKWELFFTSGYLVNTVGYAVSDPFFLDELIPTGNHAFGDLDGYGVIDLVSVDGSDIKFLKNHGIEKAPNFYNAQLSS